MREEENLRQLSMIEVDWVGFIFYPKSPRFVVLDEKNISFIQNFSKTKIGVFVNSEIEEMENTAKLLKLNYLQLHGDESVEICRELQSKGYKIIKAFPIEKKEDFEATKKYENWVDFFLFDTKTENFGGSGKSFDWKILDHYQGETPFILSGGIHPESVGSLQNIKHKKLHGIDLNSGFETKPAIKNIKAIETFLIHLKSKL